MPPAERPGRHQKINQPKVAFQHIKNIEIVGLAGCVPSNIQENASLNLFQNNGELNKFVETTGVERRRIVSPGVCASDLCYHAAERLIGELNWEKDEIDCLVFVSGTPDYLHPATACILQGRLGLPQECMSLDITMGCSGWVYGLSIIASAVAAGRFRKALLLVGDTTSMTKSPKDKSTYPLFGDAGTATALVYKEGAQGIMTHLATDGTGYRAIIVEDGGARNPFSADSLKEKEYGPGIVHNRLHTHLDGMSVFSFGISKPPKSINALMQQFQLNKDEIDYFVFHQANKMMIDKIIKKLNIPAEKTPLVLKDFGNTSSSSIPLVMVSRMKDAMNGSRDKSLKIMACGFGVGLSWGSVFFTLQNACCCDMIEL